MALVLVVVAISLLVVPGLRESLGPLVRGPWYALGFGEGCVACHGNVAGLDDPHAPEKIGCASCHAGDKRTEDKERAHAGMILVPGDLANAPRSCGQADCHESVVPRVERSIMSTMAGVIAVDRAVLGESAREGAPPPHAQRLGHGVADSHLRELCVGCHLGQAKTDWGPVTEESRGGGCNACHLEYGAAAARDLAGYAAIPRKMRTRAPATHPALTLNPRNAHCFGCHSRSGRIALSYEGWHERQTPPTPKELENAGPGPSRFRKLGDGRFVEMIVPDIHHERGMECIDCHTANELMGVGAAVARKSEQLRVGCEDCHTRRHASVSADFRDAESRQLMALRQWKLGATQRMGTTRDGDPIVNMIVEEGHDRPDQPESVEERTIPGGGAKLIRKRTGQPLALKPPAAACTEGRAHERLSCASCHARWAPRCTTCHTTFDPNDEGFDHAAQKWMKGTWNETAGPFEAVLPTLGVVTEGRGHGAVDTFVPGMIMAFDRNKVAGNPPDVVFRRLYAKLFAHTIRRESRSCKSCHNDPVALGFGRGALRYVVSGNTGRWQFKPERKASPHDGLPEDAWTGFLQGRAGMVSTREGARPFSVEEQHRILQVGACLTCHAEGSAVMKDALPGFEATLAKRSGRCAVPARSLIPSKSGIQANRAAMPSGPRRDSAGGGG